MSSYVKANEQLILEIYTGDLKASRAFYQSFGFEVVREESNFLVLPDNFAGCNKRYCQLLNNRWRPVVYLLFLRIFLSQLNNFLNFQDIVFDDDKSIQPN